MFRYVWLLASLFLVPVAEAQVVQLPSMHTFTVQTSVLVPDSGGTYAGGVGRSFQGSTSRGVPGLGPLGRNTARGGAVTGTGVMVHATIIDHEELDKLVLEEARALREGRGGTETPRLRAGTSRDASVGSLAAIKRELAAEDAAKEAEAEQDFQKAVGYERAGEVALARNYYRVAARKSSGAVKQRAMERLAALPAAPTAKTSR
jgi:hypothetical protein